MHVLCLLETLQNCDEVSRDNRELEKILSKHAQASTIQTVCSWIKTCIFRVVVETKEKCQVKQGKKLVFKNIQRVFINQQCFCKFHTFKIKRYISRNKNLFIAAAVIL